MMDKETARGWFFRGINAYEDALKDGKEGLTFDETLKIFNEEWEDVENFLSLGSELLGNNEEE